MKIDMNRRDFLRNTALVAGAAPFMWTGRATGAVAANDRITAAIIGTGRMGRGDLGNLLGFDGVQVIAVCDVDSRRAADAKRMVESRYASRKASGSYVGCDITGDYREIVARKDIDAVLICTPDHQHARPAIAAAKAGKDIYLEKPLTFTIEEGRELSDTAQRYGSVFQVGSMQRSYSNFRFGCELVRNGRIGKLLKVEVGCGIDPGMGLAQTMPVPENLDYDMWLGSAPWEPYTEKRVHPQSGYNRPGWLRCRDYTVGMMTGWGSHHMDIAHWGMGMEHGGPETIEGWAEYRDGLWDVHGLWNVHFQYPNGVDVYFGDNKRYTQGAKFYGTEGWVHVRRGRIDASPKSLLKDVIGSGEIHLYESNNHMGNFVECIKSRRETVAPVENGHRSNSACLLADIATRTGRKLRWDSVKERFVNDDTANRMLSRPARGGWGS